MYLDLLPAGLSLHLAPVPVGLAVRSADGPELLVAVDAAAVGGVPEIHAQGVGPAAAAGADAVGVWEEREEEKWNLVNLKTTWGR